MATGGRLGSVMLLGACAVRTYRSNFLVDLDNNAPPFMKNNIYRATTTSQLPAC
ncbi:hypothetical protein AG1IA_03124 [Rhizoctonia solani AG-1 IA]|uniref:Uncharacterized protein n=1 Tax=Thanatephorus cucumeris (strain AG1-IA) TaxID=983506 RepID=L8WXQ5_THACA|nr:hypothetical protein AG1IA_03124 [Rhizoctonia solani AG-1 IA]